MSKESLVAQLEAVVAKAYKSIEASLDVGDTYKLISDEDLEADDDGLTSYDLPTGYNVGKYDRYDEFSIVSVTRTESGIECEGLGRGHNTGEEHTFDLTDLQPYEICDIADRIPKS